MDTVAETNRYYTDLASAYVIGALGPMPGRTPEEIIEAGRSAGLRLHKFKRQAILPRVRRVLGILQGIGPESILDVGSGRGTFLWPCLDAFPTVPVTAIDIDLRRIAMLEAVRRGGIERLTGLQMDLEKGLALEDNYADVVTILEVLEHLQRPDLAAAEALRLAGRFVIASVPSHPDNNPQHLRLFSKHQLTDLFEHVGAANVSIDYVPNHIIAVVRV